MNSLLFAFIFISLTFASPIEPRSTTPVVTITAPAATITGLAGDVEQFPGVPFAQKPTGSLRLNPPQPITTAIGNYEATSNGPACPQFLFSNNAGLNGLIPTSELGLLTQSPLFQITTHQSEDCLYMNIYRPAGTNSTSKLPVLFWIFGGGFEIGWNWMYDGTPWVQSSVDLGQPIIFITVNYRVGGFGFLGGSEILADGSANLGLLDQRLGLQWVADNIEAFGGDPTKVTLWGESAGAISIFDHMAAYNGDNTYHGQPLFRGAIMNSGSIIPADPVDCPKAQNVYDSVVSAAGCSSASNTLECLREVDYETFLNAVNSVPFVLSYQAVALAYIPRPDGTFLTKSPDLLLESGSFAQTPFIIGDQEDEGTLFALFQSNITNNDELVEYFNFYYFNHASTQQIQNLTSFYNTNTNGSPFRTGDLWNWYPQFKILAALLGDLTFTLTRRAFLQVSSAVHADVPSWSYLSSYDKGTPILGTFHTSDLLQVFYGVLPNYASSAFRAYYITFVNQLNPNTGLDSSTYATWPQWKDGNQLLNMYPNYSQFIADNFRQQAYDFLVQNIPSFYI